MNVTARKIASVQGNNKQTYPLRFVTAASLFDGHDASINIMRRILQKSGAEVIHLAHNRSVSEVIDTAIQEDAQGIAISSYQGGHIEYFKYAMDLLREADSEHIRLFGGGGGVIVADEIEELHDYGVSRIYSPYDGQKLGLQGMIDDMMGRCSLGKYDNVSLEPEQLKAGYRYLARLITAIERGVLSDLQLEDLRTTAKQSLSDRPVPVLGITGTGGAGKSSLTDELIRRFQLDSHDALKIAILAIDPTRRKTSGALLGDRIRMNAIYHPNIYLRSIGTRDAPTELPEYTSDIIAAMQLSGFDLVVVETPGIGQGDAGIVPYVDLPMYVMTPEFGAQSQLEKIDMFDYAELVAINKFDRKGSDDAYRDVCKQLQRDRQAFSVEAESMPVYGTIASRFNDDGVTAAYQALLQKLRQKGLRDFDSQLAPLTIKKSSEKSIIVPAERQRYLAEIAKCVRDYHEFVHQQETLARECHQLSATAAMLEASESDVNTAVIDALISQREEVMDPAARKILAKWPDIARRYQGDERVDKTSSGKSVCTRLVSKSLSGNKVPRVALPKYVDQGELLKFLMLENLPGFFPYTAGVFPFKREGEAPARMFAGEGDAFRTNRRFKKLSEHSEAKRLSTAFDSVTLYGKDPDERPDIYGKIGNSGVSIATLEDMKALYDGFDLVNPSTSVSMTINGPAPTILAMYLNAAIDQQMERFIAEQNRQPNEEESASIKATTLKRVRGTVQADILKEDQGQNTCIFSTEFSLKMMGDIQQYFIENEVRNFYSVSISGYHIAEAGANPISQLAFTLANGFTFVESYLARGMEIDDFAPNLSYFFSNGMDPEYTVMGRVARRVWAVAMKNRYGANERSQRLKYHIQTSGRSLHAQEMSFNDIRTTLQALIALYDNCNSLHTNAYDEAITTPTEESVRRALAIQLIINQEWGLSKNENPNQGAFIIEELTDLVEEAVLKEFERISERGGVLGAMETGYQRSKIQEESLYYEHKKHDGSLPIIGVNTFLPPKGQEESVEIELARSTEQEKQSQIERVRTFQDRHAGQSEAALERLKQAVTTNANGFAALMDAVRYCTLGQITEALFEVGGQYRRSM
ncbi:MAG: fused isobutyryl-CoA mutase/GTPase IcmF [Candidatus Thiodiazotropha sp.]